MLNFLARGRFCILRNLPAWGFYFPSCFASGDENQQTNINGSMQPKYGTVAGNVPFCALVTTVVLPLTAYAQYGGGYGGVSSAYVIERERSIHGETVQFLPSRSLYPTAICNRTSVDKLNTKMSAAAQELEVRDWLAHWRSPLPSGIRRKL